jgi:hypothetical protein
MHEIHDVGASGLLSTEFLLAHAMRAEVAPEQLLRFGHGLA